MKLILAVLLLCSYSHAGRISKEKLKQMKEEQKWTFELQDEVKEFPTGLKKNLMAGKVRKDKSFLKAEVQLPKKFNLKDKWPNLCEIYDQGNCGSCVINSVAKNLCDSLRIRGIDSPVLSRGQLMNCGNGYQCGGYWFDGAAKDLVKLGGIVAESDYPYTPRNGNCKSVPGAKKWGPVNGYKIIDNSPKSIMTAIYSGYPVSVTVGADSPFMNYRSGTYNYCSNQGTNHEVLIEGWDCESSVDGNGFCVFDAKGKLPAGVGTWDMPNSWGEQWGVDGVMTIKITGKNGNLCNNIAEEAGILETGLKPVDPNPPGPSPTPDPPKPPSPPQPDAKLPVWVWVVFGVGGLVILLLVKNRMDAKV